MKFLKFEITRDDYVDMAHKPSITQSQEFDLSLTSLPSLNITHTKHTTNSYNAIAYIKQTHAHSN